MKEIKAFVTKDDFINNEPNTTSNLFELSDISLTYSRNKKQYVSTIDPMYSLYLFNSVNVDTIVQDEVNSIISVVSALTNFLTNTLITNKQQVVILFVNHFNQNNVSQITNFTYNNTIDINMVRSVDYLSFTINNTNCEIWLSDSIFRTFYPDYEVSIIPPVENFSQVVNNPSNFLTSLDQTFDILNFNKRIELDKGDKPTTYTKILNVPYKVPNTTVYENCYFAFNIYGSQGNYDYILKLELFNYLTTTLGMTNETVEELFPSILNINEFFITPRWDKIAIPSQVGQSSISSQIGLAYSERFDLDKFIKVYSGNNNYLRDNTYSVPFDYNNILLYITNGLHSEEGLVDFKEQFGDFITVTSTHSDFARMSQRTQHLASLLETMLQVSNVNNATELFNNIINTNTYKLTIITRAGVTYLSFFLNKHQFYILPKYQFFSLM